MNRWVVPNAFGCLSPKKEKSGAKVKDSSRGDSEVERVKKKDKKNRGKVCDCIEKGLNTLTPIN